MSIISFIAPQNPSKPNQDALLMTHDKKSSALIIACFDGHGDYGHDISSFCKGFMQKELPVHPAFISDISTAITDVTYALGECTI